MRSLLRIVAVLLMSSVSVPCAAAETPFTRNLAPVRLRGLGGLSAKIVSSKLAGGKAVSWLAISCEDETKATIVHAKYVSDLEVLGDTTKQILPWPEFKFPRS